MTHFALVNQDTSSVVIFIVSACVWLFSEGWKPYTSIAMNFFKSSFLSDLKLQDVLALSRETPGESETLISEEVASSDAENLHVSLSGMQSSSDPQSIASSDVEVCTGSATPFSSSTGQEEEGTGIWNFGSLVKSITSKSEGILQAYRKDLEEFGSGLKKETQLIADVAAHAVKDLPTSLETGAYMAQESIESVGQVVDEFSSSVWRGTADLIAQGKEAVLSIDEDQGSVPAGSVSSSSSTSRYDSTPVPISGRKYSRFEAQVRAIQHDVSTYCDEPGDLDDYTAWKSTFSFTDKKQDIDILVGENNFFQELLVRFVPEVVSEDVFWTRYFYRLQKLQKTEDARADLVKRASALEEEDLSWDTEEELEDGVHTERLTAAAVGAPGKMSDMHEPMEEVQADESKILVDEVAGLVVASHIDISDTPVSKNMSKDLVEEEEEEEEEDMGWEVPEDVEEFSSNDGKRSSNSEASWEVPDVPKEDIRKTPTAQEDEEDLSWDVDDGADEIK